MNELEKQEAMVAEYRTPEIVAAEIRQLESQTVKMVLNNSIEIGKRLCEAKEMVPHGEWGKWLKEEINFSQSTANNLMKIYKEYGDSQGQLWGASAKSQTLGNLTYSKAVALLAMPAEERESFVEENNVEDMSTRQLQEAIKAREEAEKEKAELSKELAQKDIEAEKNKQSIKTLKEQLKEEKKKAGSVEERIEEVRKEESEQQNKLKKRIKELEKEAAKSEEYKTTIKTLTSELEAKKEYAEQAPKHVAKFEYMWGAVQDNFYSLLSTIGDFPVDEQQKYVKAVGKLLDQIKSSLPGETE